MSSSLYALFVMDAKYLLCFLNKKKAEKNPPPFHTHIFKKRNTLWYRYSKSSNKSNKKRRLLPRQTAPKGDTTSSELAIAVPMMFLHL